MPMSRRNFLVAGGGTAVVGMTGMEVPPAAAETPRGVIGAPLERLDGRAKVTGRASYSFEFAGKSPTYLAAVQATIVRGRVTGVDTAEAEAVPGVHTVLTHLNAPKLANTDDAELAVLQSDAVAFRGQYVAAVVAETQESARQAASLVRISYEERPFQVVPGDDGKETEHSDQGDVDAAFASAPVTLDQTYTTPMQHHNPMEPHTTMARWADGGLTLHESTQGVHSVQETVAPVFGLDPQRVQVICPNVGGGFGSKGLPHAPLILTAMAAQLTGGRSVKYAVTRQQMFALTGYRTPTEQRIRLAADDRGQLSAISHEAHEQTSRIKEFVEGSATAAGMMYAAPNRRVRGRLSPLDLPVPTWMRAPGKCPGMYAMESAIDEMAEACGLDPVEFRIRNEPRVDPESGKPFSSRNLVGCLREGVRRFGWREPARQDGEWLVGSGVAASTYPTLSIPGSVARIRFERGRYQVMIGAADLGTGAWTALAQIAADSLQVRFDDVVPHIGSTAFPTATVAGGSTGITSWGSAIVETARVFRDRFGPNPPEGAEAEGEAHPNPGAKGFSSHAFGAQFAEVRVNTDTGEIRVPRMLGVFATGRIVNARTARSQFIGGMTMGVSMALHEQSVLDPRLGHVVNHDFAGYHIASNADVGAIEAIWLPEEDPHVNPMGTKGIGEIGIVGTAAAIANAAHHATGTRVRDLPLTPDAFLR